MVFETAVELKLLATIPDAAEEARRFMELEKLKAARKIVAYRSLIRTTNSTFKHRSSL